MLNDVRIGKKLGIGFGVATLLLVIVSAVASIGLMKAAGGFDHIATRPAMPSCWVSSRSICWRRV
jgi:UPF0716 family protein affecting phage T7 exclusion